MVLNIHQVKLMIVRETWTNNMKMKRMNNSKKIILRLMVLINQKSVKIKQKKLS